MPRPAGRALLLAGALLGAGCAGPRGPARPAADGVRAYLAALEHDRPREAYALLSGRARRGLSYEAFALQWRASAAERAWQARALAAGVRGAPDVGERAVVAYEDGRVAQLGREGAAWRLDVALLGRARARQPRDALRLFAEALARRDVDALLGLLTERRRAGLAREVQGFVRGLGRRVEEPIDEFGADRAELRWDEHGVRYRVVLRREDDEWRVDDLYAKPVAEEAPASEGEAEPELPNDP